MWVRIVVDLNYISSRYVFILSFFFSAIVRGKKWIIWCGYVWRENSGPYFYGNNYLDNVFFLTTKNRPYFQLNVDTYYVIIHIYILQLLIWIIFFFRWQPWPPRKITGVIGTTDFVYFIIFESKYLKYVHSGPKSKATISLGFWYVLGFYFYFSCMW